MHVFHMDVAKVDLNVANIAMVIHTFFLRGGYTHILQSVCSKCFIRFRCMLQVFYLDIAYVVAALHICCMCMFQIFQMYVAASVSCCKCFMKHILLDG
jgi:hypothetical protein